MKNIDQAATRLLGAIGTALILTSIFGRKTAAPTISALTGGVAAMMSAALGIGQGGTLQ